MKLVLLFGGRGSEHAVSVRSAAYVLPRLAAAADAILPVFVAKDGGLFRYMGGAETLSDDPRAHARPLSMVFSLGTLSFCDGEGEPFTPDLVFSVMHGKDGEDGAWQGVLTLARIPFVGAPIFGSAVAMHKRAAKELAAAHGVPILPFLSARAYTEELALRVAHRLTYPLFVKPNASGSSVGVSRVGCEKHLKEAVERALREGDEVLIEEAAEGSELEVAVLAREGVLLLSPPGEIRTEGAFYDYDTKYERGGAQFSLPASLSLWETAYVKQLAATVFRATDCRDLARVDFFRRPDGKIFFNEINTLPGFTADSLFPRLFALIGVDPITFLLESYR